MNPTPLPPPLNFLRPLLRSRFYRRYRWAIAPLLVILALQANAHMYYKMDYGYDMPQHAMNMYALLNTGHMPPPPLAPSTYEAGQPPLFYVLSAVVFRLAESVAPPGVYILQEYIALWLMVFSASWALLAAFFVQQAMRRAAGWWKALTLLVVMLFPVIQIMNAMFNNDLAVNVLLTWGVILLWLMVRSARTASLAMWLRVAAIIGLAIAFKVNGAILLAIYGVTAAWLAGQNALSGRLKTAARVVAVALLGLPLMLAPLLYNVWHARQYHDNIVNVMVPPQPVWEMPISFFTTFDTSIFERPFAFGPGEGSYWSLQYVTLHQDYYNFWNSPVYQDMPLTELSYPGTRTNIPGARFQDAVRLMYLAIPATLMIVLGLTASLARMIRRPRQGTRDGSLVIALTGLGALGADIWRFSNYANIQAAIIHARFIAFSYVILFVIGMAWAWKLWGRQRAWWARILMLLLAVALLAYAAIAFRRMWLPAY